MNTTATTGSADSTGFRSLLAGLPLAAWRQLRFGGWRLVALYGAMQLLVALLCAPMMRWLFTEVLASAGLHSVEMSTIGAILSTPLSLTLLVVLFALALCIVSLQLLILVSATRRLRLGEAVTARAVLADTKRVALKLFRPGSLALLWYLFIVLPMAGFGFLSVLSNGVAIPPFVSGELLKSPTGIAGYIVFLLLAAFVNLRLALTLPLFALSDVGGFRAMRQSWRLTRRVALPLLAAVAGVLLASLLAQIALVALALAPTALADLLAPDAAPVVAAISLALAQLIGLLLVGAAVVAIAAMLVELLDRVRSRLPEGVTVLELGAAPAASSASAEKTGTGTPSRGGAIVLGVAVLAAIGLSLVSLPVMQALNVQPQTQVLGHRGFNGVGVENTLSGLDAALAGGADMVEMDVMQTKDGQLVAMHDANLTRLTGQDLQVAELTLDEITQLSVTDMFGLSDRIPSFHDYLAHAQKIGMPLLVELKVHGAETPSFVADVVAEMESQGALTSNIYHSLSQPLVDELKTMRPGLSVGYTMAFAGVAAPETLADFIVVEGWSYNTELRDSAWDAGLAMYVWTVNDELVQRQMLRDDVEGLITDVVDVAVASRAEMLEQSGLADTLFDALMRFVVVV